MARILVIEDDLQVRGVFREALEGAGHTVTEAENGAAGTRLFRERGADLVITNILMPEKDGFETIRDLRRDSVALPIIAVSAGSPRLKMDILKSAALLGASRTLAKPFDLQALVDSVRELVGPATPPPASTP
jgi:DNA-binding response OmpR family regulator